MNERRTMEDDGRQPIAIGHLSDSGDLKGGVAFFISTTPQQNFVKLCSYEAHRCAYFQESLIQFFSWELCPFRTFLMKYTTETVCQHNSSETAQQNFVKLFFVMEGHSV